MLTGFILAGGHSRRMGCEKALMRIQGRRLIDHVAGRLRAVADAVFVVARPGNTAAFRELPVDGVLTDLAPGFGPLMGVYTGLMTTASAVNLFVPCDMPFVASGLMSRLARACGDTTPVVSSVHPGEGWQPFPLACHVSALRTVGALLDRGDRSLSALLMRPGAAPLMVDETDLGASLTNVNTLVDYVGLCEERADTF